MLQYDIPIFFHTDQTAMLKDLNVEYSFEDCEVRQVAFFSIVAVSVYDDDKGNYYSSVHANGGEYISPLSKHEVIEIIKTANSCQ